jgi:hypothetical protein
LPNEPKHGRKHPCEVLYKDCSLTSDLIAILIDDLPMMLPTMFPFICQSGFREEDFLEINQSETRIAFGSLVC